MWTQYTPQVFCGLKDIYVCACVWKPNFCEWAKALAWCKMRFFLAFRNNSNLCVAHIFMCGEKNARDDVWLRLGRARLETHTRGKRCIGQSSRGKVCTSCEFTSSTSGQLPFRSTTARIYLPPYCGTCWSLWVSYLRANISLTVLKWDVNFTRVIVWCSILRGMLICAWKQYCLLHRTCETFLRKCLHHLNLFD